jgi:hypothetical protein
MIVIGSLHPPVLALLDAMNSVFGCWSLALEIQALVWLHA